MAKTWLRMIDSAQRRIVLNAPRSPTMPGVVEVVFDIQGIELSLTRGGERFGYDAMASLGVEKRWAPPLTVWQRLGRKAAPVGLVKPYEDHGILVTFWTPVPFDLVFWPALEAEARLWRECEIMVLSAGFRFEGETRR